MSNGRPTININYCYNHAVTKTDINKVSCLSLLNVKTSIMVKIKIANIENLRQRLQTARISIAEKLVRLTLIRKIIRGRQT